MAGQPNQDSAIQSLITRGPQSDLWDFSPFLSSPAVIGRRDLEGSLQVVNIPDSVIPSPFAPNLTPSTLVKIKEHLLGTNDHPGPGNGKEVWESWKRAWDIWNNHYIERRVNPVYIAEEFQGLKKRFDDEDQEEESKKRAALWKSRRDNMRAQQGAHVHPPQAVNLFDAGDGVIQLQAPGDGTTDPTPSAGQGASLGQRMSQRLSGQGAGAAGSNPGDSQLRPDGTPQTSGPYLVDSKGNVVAGPDGRPGLPPRANSSATMPAAGSNPDPNPGYPDLSSAVEAAGANDDGLGFPDIDTFRREWQSDLIAQGLQVPATTGFTNDPHDNLDTLDSPEDDAPDDDDDQDHSVRLPVQATRASAARYPRRKVKFADMKGNSDNGQGSRNTSKQTSGQGSRPKRMPARDDYQSYAHIGGDGGADGGTGLQSGANDVVMSNTTDTDPRKEQPIGFGTGQRQPGMNFTSSTLLLNDDENDDDDAWHLRQRRIPDPGDGRSGGWVPMKNLPHFRFPEDPCLEDDDPKQIEWDELVWEDPIENSVWAPRRVGEKTLKIDIDNDDAEDDPELTAHGGIDCGKEPYPVLRYLNEYTESKDGTLKKKKVWDGVTGSIFNLPTKPLEPSPEPKDERKSLIKNLFAEPHHDYRLEPRYPTFPLDIRRVEKVLDKSTAPKSTPLLEANERLIVDRTTPSTEILPDDSPWHITDEQRSLRDNPRRRWPPAVELNGTLLPTDDTIWREEYTKDQHLNARYFVTNLDGGTLLINGQQVRRGCIAGPLPAFAVIESPGGQVSFWWGINGRNYKAGVDNGQPLEHKWNLLRKQKGWEYIAESAGAVWEKKILARVRAERTGNRNNDDEIWNEWKKTEKAEEKDEDYDGKEFPLDEEPRFTGLDDGDFELRWLTAYMLRLNNDPRTGNKKALIEPTEEEFWPGSQPRVDSTVKPLTRADINDLWSKNTALVATLTANQKRENERLKKKQDQEDAAAQAKLDAQAAATRKRMADGTLNLDIKRRRFHKEERLQEVIDNITQQQDKRQDVLVQIVENERLRLRKLERDANLARYLKDAKPADRARFIKEFEQAEKTQREQEKKLLVEVNRKRKLAGRPELPTREDFEANRYKRPIPDITLLRSTNTTQTTDQNRLHGHHGVHPPQGGHPHHGAHPHQRTFPDGMQEAPGGNTASTTTAPAPANTTRAPAHTTQTTTVPIPQNVQQGVPSSRNPETPGRRAVRLEAQRRRIEELNRQMEAERKKLDDLANKEGSSEGSEKGAGDEVQPPVDTDADLQRRLAAANAKYGYPGLFKTWRDLEDMGEAGYRQGGSGDIDLKFLRAHLPREHVERHHRDFIRYQELIDEATGKCLIYLRRREAQGGITVRRLARIKKYSSIEAMLVERKRRALLAAFDTTELQEEDVPFMHLTYLKHGSVGKKELIREENNRHEKFWEMLMKIQGMESQEVWSRDPRGMVVTDNEDGTRSLEF